MGITPESSQTSEGPFTWLVVAAMEVEEQAVLDCLSPYQVLEISRRLGIDAVRADYGAHRLLVVRSGIGQVHAALAVAAVEAHTPVDAVLLLGVAGALREDLAIGDMVLPAHVVQHDALYSSPDGVELMAPGQPFVSVPKEQRADPVFAVDARLHKRLVSLLAAAGVRCQPHGTLLSGSEFVACPRRKQELADRHRDAVVVEMEAAGVAQVARRLGIPFVVAKTIADRLTPEGAIFEDYLQFTQRAAKNAAQIVQVLTAQWLHA